MFRSTEMVPWGVLLKPQRTDLFGLALGFFATVCQVAVVREALSIGGGNEWTVALSFFSWLVGVGCGALVAWPLPNAARALTLGLSAAPVLAGGGLLVLRLHRLLLAIPPGGNPSMGGLVLLLFIGPGAGGLAMGFLFTAMARAFESSANTPVSRLYATEAMGSLLGGLAFALVFAGSLPHLVTIGLGAAMMTAAAAALTSLSPRTRMVQGALAGLLACGLIAGPVSDLDRWAEKRAFFRSGAPGSFVKSVDSAYSHLTLSRHEDQYQLFRDHRYETAFPDPWQRPVIIHLALTQHPDPKRVLIIGGGPSDRLDAVLAHGVERVVLTYLDKRVHDLCRPYWPAATVRALADPRVAVVLDDGRRYLSETKEKFDVVVVSSRLPFSAQASRYHTREFFAAVKNALRPSGSMTVFTHGGANLLAPEAARAAASELATVRSVFPHLAMVPDLQITLHAASRPGVVSDDPAVLETRYRRRNVQTPFFSARRFRSLLDKQRIAAVTQQLGSWPGTVNTDARPTVYLAGLQLWERSLSGNRTARDPTWTGTLERTAWVWLALPLLIWFSLRYGLHRRAHRNRADGAVFAIATTGAAGMAVEIVVLYVFQIASGQVYTGLALLVALFMAGLALGAFIARNHLAGGRLLDGALADGAMIALLALTGPVLNASFATPWIIATWSALAGIVTGAAFPALLNRIAKQRQGDERKAAPATEAADHFGAAFGALITGVVWIPVYGITATCWLFVLFKAASLIGQLPLHRRTKSI